MQLLVQQVRLTFIIVFLLISSAISFGADLSPAEIVAKHLDAIGSPQARNVKSRVVQGGATYRVLVGGTGAIDGKSVIASEGEKSDFLFKINATGFHGEQFIFDGKKASVAGTYPDHSRSEFGNFVLAEDIVLRENLLGGVWSLGWPLLDVEGRKAKLHNDGIKKMDGKDLLTLRYQPKKNTDLEIFLYFDPQTYQHVMTVYKVEPSGSLAGGETAQSGKSARHYRIDERFSDFKTADGLTLPNHYDLRFTLEAENGFTKSIEWEVRALKIDNNISIDPRSFEVK